MIAAHKILEEILTVIVYMKYRHGQKHDTNPDTTLTQHIYEYKHLYVSVVLKPCSPCLLLGSYCLWSTNTDIGHDTNADTLSLMIICKNELIERKHTRRCRIDARVSFPCAWELFTALILIFLFCCYKGGLDASVKLLSHDWNWLVHTWIINTNKNW